MSSVKICFSDLVVELEGTEPNQELADRALTVLAFLVQEKLRYDEFFPAEEDMDTTPPEGNTIPSILPPEAMKAYL